MSIQAARFVHWIHWIFLLFVIGGWLLPWSAVWMVHLLVVPSLIVHWRTNNNRCILTEMEERLKQHDHAVSAPRLEIPIGSNQEPAVEGQFIRGVIEKLTGQVPSDSFMTGLIYGVMAIVWALSLGRLLIALQTS